MAACHAGCPEQPAALGMPNCQTLGRDWAAGRTGMRLMAAAADGKAKLGGTACPGAAEVRQMQGRQAGQGRQSLGPLTQGHPADDAASYCVAIMFVSSTLVEARTALGASWERWRSCSAGEAMGAEGAAGVGAVWALSSCTSLSLPACARQSVFED